MSVKPKIQEFLTNLEKIKAYFASINFKPNQGNAREALANTTRMYMTEIDLSVFAVDDVAMNGHYPVPLRIYHPKPGQALPVAVFIHGGGHMCGSVAVYDGIVRKLSKKIDHIVVSIDYRLAPEFPYPTGIEDCKAAIRNIFKILDERKIAYSSKELTIIGDSGGGAFCASIVMDKEFVATEQIKKQVLIYASTDYTLTSPTLDTLGTGYFLEKPKIAWYFDNYFQNNEDRKHASPLYGEFYANMPDTLVIVASHDPLFNDGASYYQNVINVGAKAELVTIDGVVHAYLMLENLCKEECDYTYQEIAHFLHS